MGYELGWHDEAKTIIVARSSERLSYPEMDQLFNEVVAMADETAQPFYFILELAALKRVEALNIREMQKLGRHPYTRHPNRYGTYVASLSPRVRMVVDAFSRLFPRYTYRLYTAEDLNHALRMIEADKQKVSAAG